MSLLSQRLGQATKAALFATTLCMAIATSAVTIPNVPLSVQQSVKPMVMLVAGKDHRFFYEAYNDAGDVDGDGTLDIRYKPSITYLGLFQPNICYTHNSKSDKDGLFTPSSAASAGNKCSSKWSGNWLNYITTSRIDALRVVLYGGFREVDTESSTILRRAYIPQDAHSWAKEYTSETVDGYKISDYTPLSQPSSNKRHFFGNLTPNAGKNCKDLKDCSDIAPWMSVVTNSSKRVWEWASTERPVLADGTHGGTRENYSVRVTVCASGFTGGCKLYPNNKFKPVGILHDYGESDSMLFGLLTGSYDKSMSGGRLRKVVSSFKDEVDATTGIFTGNDTIVRSFDNMRIRDFNNDRTDNAYRKGWDSAARAMTSGEFADWGNPIAEMMYEAVRYFAGKGAATADFAGTKTVDDHVGMPSTTWDDPYSSTSAAKAPTCARGNLLTISDVNVSFDSDEVPGAYSGFGSFTGDLTGFSAATEATFITANEPSVSGQRFIGQSGATADSAPSPKAVSNLGQIRGLAPEEPTKQGSYYAASVSYFAKSKDLRADKAGKQTLDTFVVALASPLPRISPKLPNGKVITLVPFAKSISGSGITKAKTAFQPTNQIVDFYVEEIANSGSGDANASINGGRYYAKFRINYEDVEQGADHDMDAIVEYTVQANADNTLSVTVKPVYEAGGIQHRMGYIISGTTKDGVYLVVQDESEENTYYLNTPPGRDPGYCDVTSPPNDCKRLPYTGGASPNDQSSRTFSPISSGTAASLLNDPLWYAAKWGGHIDKNSNNKPDLASEWDADGDGVPDTYLLVQNPLKLKESLKKTLDNIASRSSSASNISANSTSISSSSRLYQAVFNTQRWSGDLIAYPATTSGVGSAPAWEAAAALPAWNARNIFMRTSGGNTIKLNTYGGLSAIDEAHFVDSDTFEYLRGNRAKELQNGGILRDREHALGDIVHSSPFFEKDSNVVYVGANDGMLHAFNGQNGAELFAFMPRAVVPRLKNIAALGYTHDYLVDGDVLVTPKVAGTGNKNYLFSMLGRGGKGLFALNVTSPTTFGTGNFLWEYTPTGSVAAAATDNDLGHMIGRSIFVQLNNGKSGIIAGNGYNSTSGKAVLYIFIINTNGTLSSVQKIDTGAADDNGLAPPTFVDTDNNGTADVVYAGDLKGNVWKFDLSSATPSSWAVSYSGSPLFVARDSSAVRQPITAPMYTAVNDKTGDPNIGKRFVFFGTGSYFKTGDASSTQEQTWYGVIDDNAAGVTRSDMKERTVLQTGTFAVSSVRTFSKATSNDMTGKKGWYLDLDSPFVGERIVTISKIVPFVVPALVSSSLYPVPSDPCVPGGNGYLNLIDPFSGAAITSGILDVNGNNDYTDDKLGGDPIGSLDLAIGIPTEPLTLGAGDKVNIYIGGSGSSSTSGSLIKHVSGLGVAGNKLKGRISWREIVRD